MHIILTLDQHDMGLISPDDGSIEWTRRAVRAVAFNENNQVALIEFSKIDAKKLPGGGVDEGEELIVALKREVKEEIGYEIAEIISEIGIVEEYRYYSRFHQISYTYIVRVGKFVGTDPSENELQQGIQTHWYKNISEAIQHIQKSSDIDEDGDEIGGIMMNQRDIAILEEASKLLKSK